MTPSVSPACPLALARRPGSNTRRLCFLLLPIVLACRALSPIQIRMYDYRSPDVLELTTTGLSKFGPTKGWIDFRAPGGELFKGSWLKTDTSADGDDASGDLFSSIPRISRDYLKDKWGWLSDVGFDFAHPPSECILLVMNGDRGTVLDGIAFFHGSLFERDGVIGVARDNRGHHYRIIGQPPAS